MHIGLISNHTFGGSTKVASAVARVMAARGHHVSLFARSRPPSLTDSEGVTFHGAPTGRPVIPLDVRWPPEESEAMVRQIQQVAAERELDVLHAHYALPHTRTALEVRRRMNGRSPAIVVTLHGTDVSVFGSDSEHGPQLARDLTEVDAVTTVSHAHAELAAETFGLADLPLVIPNFVDTDRFRPAARARRRARRRARILHMSSFRPVKDPDLLAEIFLRVRRHADAELWLLGDGEGLRLLRQRLSEAGAMDDVRLLGARPDVERVLPQADVLLVSSKAESFSLAALEASASGLPVVAPRVGGLPEVVTDGTTGILFEPGDADAGAGAVIELLRDPERARGMGRAGVRWARRFTPDLVAGRYEALYRDVIAVRVRQQA